jgi:hypothetical protein
MATGDANDIVRRVKRLIPTRWFAYVAPLRDAVVGGLADGAAWCYGWITYARSQSRLATANGLFLDIYVNDFLGRFLQRNGLDDPTFSSLARATILKERVTRAGMAAAVTTLTGSAPWIFEPWNTGDTGAWSNSHQTYGQMGYGVGIGGWGGMNYTAQVFMKVVRGANSGVPKAAGYGTYAGGWSGPNTAHGEGGPYGAIELAGSFVRLEGVTDQVIENLITYTRPTGVTVWLQIS